MRSSRVGALAAGRVPRIGLRRRRTLIVHAGDLITARGARASCERFVDAVAVHGNVDDAAVRAALPAMAVVSCSTAGGSR